MIKQSGYLCLALAILLPLQASADELRVPDDYPTIQAAIDASANGDIVRVSLGLYVENLNFRGKAISVESIDGPEQTIIDGGDQGSVVTFNTSELPTSVLSGFTLTNGHGTGSLPEGGGIFIAGSSPTIRNNFIVRNRACTGAGVAILSGGPLLEQNLIAFNQTAFCTGGFGAGIYLLGSHSNIRENTIYRNMGESSGGLDIFVPRGDVIRNNLIAENSSSRAGGGIVVSNSERVWIIQNVIVGNTARQSAAGVLLHAIPEVFVNNTIADNDFMGTPPTGGTALVIYSLSAFTNTFVSNNIIVSRSVLPAVWAEFPGEREPSFITNNDFWNLMGPTYGGAWPDLTGRYGNLSADPFFVDPDQGDYHFLAASPCIDVGRNDVPDLEDTDFDGNPRIVDGSGIGYAIIDLGAYEFPGAGAHRKRCASAGSQHFVQAWERYLEFSNPRVAH